MIDWIVPGALLFGLFVTLVFILLRTNRSESGTEVKVRLSAIEQQQARAQQVLFEQLNRQQSDLTEILDKRLARNTTTVTQSILEYNKNTGKTLGDVREQLGKIVQAQENITKLSANVVSLQEVLSNRHARGAFGETQMKDIVRNALPPNAYDFQATLSSETGGNVRVDCLIQVPNPPGPVSVDSKFPLEGYNALRSAKDELSQKAARRLFSDSVTKHLKDIASKYIVPGKTADLALMFLPSEAVYAEIHAEFPDLVQVSQELRVYIVSPTTMMATLNTIRAILRDAEMRKHATEIVRSLALVGEDVSRLDKRVSKLASHFDQAQKDVSDISTSTRKIVNRVNNLSQRPLEEPPNLDPATAEIPDPSETNHQS